MVPDALVITRYHEDVDLTVCTPKATLEWYNGNQTGHQYSENVEYFKGVPNQLVFYFPEDSLPDDIVKATVTYVGVCDKYGNERKVTDQECATSTGNLAPAW